MSHKIHLDKIRRNLRSKQLLEIRKKAIEVFFAFQGLLGPNQMVNESSSSSKISPAMDQITQLQGQLLLELTQKFKESEVRTSIDAKEVSLILKQKKERPIDLPQISKIIAWLIQEFGNPAKRTLIIKCFESVAQMLYRMIFHALKRLAKLKMEYGNTACQEIEWIQSVLTCNFARIGELMINIEENFYDLQDHYQKFFLTLEHQRMLLFETLSVLNSTPDLQRLSYFAYNCICTNQSEPTLHPCLQLFYLSLTQDQVTINLLTAHEIREVIRSSLLGVTKKVTFLNTHLLLMIAEILMSYAEETTEEVLEVVFELINFGTHLFFDSKEECYQLTDSILRLMNYLSQYFPTSSEVQKIQIHQPPIQIYLKKWSLFCEKIILCELLELKNENNVMLACSVLRILGKNSEEQTANIVRQLSCMQDQRKANIWLSNLKKDCHL